MSIKSIMYWSQERHCLASSIHPSLHHFLTPLLWSPQCYAVCIQPVRVHTCVIVSVNAVWMHPQVWERVQLSECMRKKATEMTCDDRRYWKWRELPQKPLSRYRGQPFVSYVQVWITLLSINVSTGILRPLGLFYYFMMYCSFYRHIRSPVIGCVCFCAPQTHAITHLHCLQAP